MLDVKRLRVLREVAAQGSFSAAADALSYTQSAVSQQIATLERAVGERLIDRPGGPRKVSMTEAGRVLLRHAERVVAGMEAAWADLAALAAGDAGTIRVGTYQSVGSKILPELMRRLVTERPGLDIHLTESASDVELLDHLERGDLDLTFAVLPVDDGPFEAIELMRDPYHLMVAADSPLAAQGVARLRDMHELPMIGFRHCVCGERIDGWLRERGVQSKVVFRSDDNGTVQGLVGAGMAAALVPHLAADEADEAVALLDIEGGVPERRIAIAWHRDRSLSPAARSFIALARELCAELGTPVVREAVGS